MSKAMGYNHHLLIKRESSWGVNPGGNFLRLPVNSAPFGRSRGKVEDPLIGQGRDPLQVYDDMIDVSGACRVPVDLRNIGFWLTGLLGNPTSSGSGPYTHVFKSGGLTLPSYSIENGHKGPVVYDLATGVMVRSMSFAKATRGGPADATVNLLGQNAAKAGSTGGGTPTSKTLARFSNFQGTLKKGGADLGDVKTFEFSYDNNFEVDTFVNTVGEIGSIDPGQAKLKGSIGMRFANDDLLDEAIAGTAIDLDLTFTIDADSYLELSLNELYLEEPKRGPEGPGGYDITFPFHGVYNASAGAMLTATLKNDQAGTVYTAGP